MIKNYTTNCIHTISEENITFFVGDGVHFAHVHVFAMYGVGNLLVLTFVTMAGNDLEASRVTKLRLVISLFRDFAN